MKRKLSLLLLLLLLPGLPAAAQTSCTQQSQAQLLSSFSDSVAPGGITPQTLRNFVCSVPGFSAGTPVVVTPGASPYVYTAAVPGVLYISSGTIAVSRNNGVNWYAAGTTGGQYTLVAGDSVQITYGSVPTVTFFPGG